VQRSLTLTIRLGLLALIAAAALAAPPAAAAPARIPAAQSCDPCPATATDDLNLRKGPNLGDAVLLVIPAGSTVLRAVSGDTNGYAPVTYGGVAGWAATAYLVGGGFDGGLAELTVTADLNLRAGPSLGDAVLRVMPAGSTVLRGDQVVNGFRLVTFQGTTGWAFEEYLAGGDDGPSGATRVTLVSLNLRAAPSLSAGVILVMPPGSSVTLLRTDGAEGFVQVDYAGTVGWAYADNHR
jgi:uncharacterized protein YraI